MTPEPPVPAIIACLHILPYSSYKNQYVTSLNTEGKNCDVVFTLTKKLLCSHLDKTNTDSLSTLIGRNCVTHVDEIKYL